MISVRTVSGRRIDLSRPRAEDFALDDIATGLSHCCRFAGQVREFYSVAQHAVLVACLAPRHLVLHALHHDDSEAYMGDLSRHLKHHDLLAGYRALEAPVQAAIMRSLRLPALSAEDTTQIKIADDVAALYEHLILRRRVPASPEAIRQLIDEGFVRSSYEALTPTIERLPQGLEPWPSERAREMFLQLHETFKGVTV